VLVTAEQLGPAEAEAFGTGRAAFFNGLQDDPDAATGQRVAAAGLRWALADAAASLSDTAEREALRAVALGVMQPDGRLPGVLRGLAVLEALALRSLRRGGRPLMEGRGSALAALKAAIFLT
jgi:15-cis-phytoene synthase